jgi:hypothetical protein
MAKPKPYEPPVSQLLALGDPREGDEFGQPPDRWLHYRALGLSEVDADELVRLATDKHLHTLSGDRTEVWAGLHAWRALGQLQVAKAVGPLLDLLEFLEKHEDDWGLEEMPQVLGMIGPAAIEPAARFLVDATRGLYARIAASVALREIARRHPDCRAACVGRLVERLAHGRWNDPALNGFIVAQLLELRAIEAAPIIEKAFALGQVDPSIVGGWEDVRQELKGKVEPHE